MNILVLSENYIRGGLETQIHTYWCIFRVIRPLFAVD